MATPILGTTGYDLPPAAIRGVNPDLYDYLLMLHVQIFGLPTSSGGNVGGAGSVTNHALLSNVTPYQHHGAGTHSALLRASAVTDAPAASSTAPAASTVAVVSADADTTFFWQEQALLNELKGDLTQAVADLNALVSVVGTVRTDLASVRTTVNALLAALRTAAVMSP